ncbi:hypothetical protein SPBR_01374 [Sporothrix brasiliensis 5110]|uniref:Zn(2)-C6 fungal-type domain-containing protein n=1 Tax=Sporothrix brasiliensis 5110 TaxID=1398154 RepID=A0A0C2FJS3_9PEZI|nr:uncharacterized protein SPBR_01374 [Sporothrix brasiliensis 5110]KIH91278.1 hypothetical protein SPBR_01374 [Sporothrix brasiliensis 5110]
MSSTRPQRLLRISKACDFCHKRRIKCQDNPGDTRGRCRNCAEFDIPCTYARPSRRGRGSPQPSRPASATSSGLSIAASSLADGKPVPHHPPSHQPPPSQPLPQPHRPAQSAMLSPSAPRVTMSERTTSTSYGADDQGPVANERLSSTWQAFAHTSTPTLKRLVTVYHETVFPIFPFFDPVRLQRRLDQLEHVSNRAFFCSVMAACALASARARDGALSSSTSGGGISASPGSAASGTSIEMPPEMFYAAAEEALPKDILQCRDFDYLRALALLSIASIQDAKIAVMQKYIGHYFTLLAINQWHDEANWSPGLTPTEIEERRRLYWSTYTLDVFTAIIWDGCIHFQESHAKVEYPTGVTEDRNGQPTVPNPASLSNTANVDSSTRPTNGPTDSPSSSSMLPGIVTATSPLPDAGSWMIGWNYTTDLYRILEHNLNKLRSRSSKFNLLGETTTPGSFRVSSQDRVSELYAALPNAFKTLQPATGDPARDIFGFQAANIQATMALLEMVHLSLEVDVDVERKCSVVHNVLQTFHQVPKAYMRAISTPLIYHIGGIGVILGSVMEGPLSESAYRLVRDLLLSMAMLLESLEAFLHRGAGAGARLRSLVARLEGFYSDVRNQIDNGANTNGATAFTAQPSSEASASNLQRTQQQQKQKGQQQQTIPSSQQQTQPQLEMNSSFGPEAVSIPQPLPSEALNQQDYQQPQQRQQQQYRPIQQQFGQPRPLSPSTGANPTAAYAAAASMYDPQQQQQQQQQAAGSGTPSGLSPSSAAPGTWVAAPGAAGVAPDVNMQMQLQLPDEFLQDWTWPFAVSNNYLSF